MWAEYGNIILTLLFSAVVSTIVSVLISTRFARKEQRRQDRIILIMEFFSLGFGVMPSREFWTLMRKAKLLFYENKKARKAIDKLHFDDYLDDGPNGYNDVAWALDHLDMLTQMCIAVGYKHKFTKEEMERIAL